MFVTLPLYEFHVPPALAAAGASHWRVMELSVHLPWFIVSVRRRDAGGVTFLKSYFLAWEKDAVSFLPTLDPKDVAGVVCMAPGWKSPSGDWSAHNVREIWIIRSTDGSTYLELVGVNGSVLNLGQMTDADPAHSQRERLFQMPSDDVRSVANSW